jgi:hypothetical protein
MPACGGYANCVGESSTNDVRDQKLFFALTCIVGEQTQRIAFNGGFEDLERQLGFCRRFHCALFCLFYTIIFMKKLGNLADLCSSIVLP